jgi:hypothetical protein
VKGKERKGKEWEGKEGTKRKGKGRGGEGRGGGEKKRKERDGEEEKAPGTLKAALRARASSLTIREGRGGREGVNEVYGSCASAGAGKRREQNSCYKLEIIKRNSSL